jgi:hypothetical protein
MQADPNKTTAGTATSLNMLGYATNLPIPGFVSVGGFENQSTMQRRINTKLLLASNLINQKSQRGSGNFIVTNVMIASAIQDNSKYTFNPSSTQMEIDNGTLYPMGTCSGMSLYVDPTMDLSDNRVLVGRKGKDEEPGLKLMPYIMAETISTIAEQTMATKMAVKSRYALVEAGFHPQTMYYTFVVDNAHLLT